MLELTEQQQLILKGKLCPYCKREPEYVNSGIVYGKDYGMIYLCQLCRAWVGVHKGTDNALGRLANLELREAKIEAHKYFDMIWRGRGLDRKECYAWLSGLLGIPKKYCHIGMFGPKTCRLVVYHCKWYLNAMRVVDKGAGLEPKTEEYDLEKINELFLK